MNNINNQSETIIKLQENQIERKKFIFASPFRGYSQIKSEDRAHINTVAMIVLFCIALSIFVGHLIDGSKGVYNAIIAILIGIVTGASFSILDRIGVASPAEERMEKIFESTEDQRAKMIDILEETQDYTKYSNSRKKFGFNNVMGNLEQNPDGTYKMKRRSDEFAIDKFINAKSGSVIRYMNTFMENDSDYYDAIKLAVTNGVNLKIMLLKPDANSPAFQNRYIDCMEELFDHQSIETVAEMMKARLRQLDALMKSMKNQSISESGKGSLEVRYYTKSLNFPMLLLTENPEIASKPDVAYTGFYGTISSEAMPYVEWRGGDFRMIEKLTDIFDRKWNQIEIIPLD